MPAQQPASPPADEEPPAAPPVQKPISEVKDPEEYIARAEVVLASTKASDAQKSKWWYDTEFVRDQLDEPRLGHRRTVELKKRFMAIKPPA
jgi:hypothetical protein